MISSSPVLLRAVMDMLKTIGVLKKSWLGFHPMKTDPANGFHAGQIAAGKPGRLTSTCDEENK